MADVPTMTRCPALNQFGVRCVQSTGHSTEEHYGWQGETERRWSVVPLGPQTEDEWEAAAWELTGGLGLEIEPATINSERMLVVAEDALARWFDQRRLAVMGAWHAHMQGPADEPEPDVREALKEFSAERLDDADRDGKMIDHSNDVCQIPDCGCNGEAHP